MNELKIGDVVINKGFSVPVKECYGYVYGKRQEEDGIHYDIAFLDNQRVQNGNHICLHNSPESTVMTRVERLSNNDDLSLELTCYYSLMAILDTFALDRAYEEVPSSFVEACLALCEACDSNLEDAADANDCGNISDVNEFMLALRKLFDSGERVSVKPIE